MRIESWTAVNKTSLRTHLTPARVWPEWVSQADWHSCLPQGCYSLRNHWSWVAEPRVKWQESSVDMRTSAICHRIDKKFQLEWPCLPCRKLSLWSRPEMFPRWTFCRHKTSHCHRDCRGSFHSRLEGQPKSVKKFKLNCSSRDDSNLTCLRSDWSGWSRQVSAGRSMANMCCRPTWPRGNRRQTEVTKLPCSQECCRSGRRRSRLDDGRQSNWFRSEWRCQPSSDGSRGSRLSQRQSSWPSGRTSQVQQANLMMAAADTLMNSTCPPRGKSRPERQVYWRNPHSSVGRRFQPGRVRWRSVGHCSPSLAQQMEKKIRGSLSRKAINRRPIYFHY